MLMSDGEFLIRESTKKVGQYVLTGMAAGKPQHLLLMDKEGRVRWVGRERGQVEGCGMGWRNGSRQAAHGQGRKGMLGGEGEGTG